MSSMNEWSTVNPGTLSGEQPAELFNLLNGEWQPARQSKTIVDPMNGEEFVRHPDTQSDELAPFVESLNSCPKNGLHNPLKNVERYLMLGDVCFRVAETMRREEVADRFARLIMRVSPKSYAQAMGEVVVTRKFFENFGGDNVRFLARAFTTVGDYQGQESTGYRWPLGPVALIYPFNFPLEIPGLQLMGALFMGNKPTVKACDRTGLVMCELIRLLHHCGLPKTDIDFIHCSGQVMHEFLLTAQPRVTQFTGSSKVAELLARDLHGKVKIEDAGFDWKILGPDVSEFDYVAWQADQDAYASLGQKCSAQSILFAHENWMEAGILERLQALVERRSLDDLTMGPLLSVTNDQFTGHMNNLLKIPGARLLWGGEEIENHTIPERYGSMKPTAVFVPIEELVKEENFGTCVTEIFGQFQVVTSYTEDQLPMVLDATERMSHHLTAAVVSNDMLFMNKVLANTQNGTQYSGIRARTTAAPQHMWFGPSGDPRGAGIGTREAIHLTWSHHREIVTDMGPVPQGWTTPDAS